MDEKRAGFRDRHRGLLTEGGREMVGYIHTYLPTSRKGRGRGGGGRARGRIRRCGAEKDKGGLGEGE